MPLINDERVGIYHAATALADVTKEPIIVWLQRLAKALTNSDVAAQSFCSVIDSLPDEIHQPEDWNRPKPPMLRIPSVDLRKVEGEALFCLEELAASRIFDIPSGLEHTLRSVFIYRNQLVSWLAYHHRIDENGDALTAGKRTRSDAMDAEIREIKRSGIPLILADIWHELLRRAVESKASSDTGKGPLLTTCCLRPEEIDGKLVIVWRGSDKTTNIERLTQDLLKKKIEKLR